MVFKLFFLLCYAFSTCYAKPNVVIIMADDYGSYDASYHGSNQILTPNIDALAYHGVILDRFYTPSLCTPSRSSAMTGKDPHILGMQTWVIPPDEAYGLGLDQKLMSNYFQENGYKTHLVGKWHLGHFQRKYTPTYRGFDSFFGYYNGAIDYYNYTWVQSPFPPGYDMRKNSDVNYLNLPGKYATEMFTDQALRIIDKHDDSKKSLFLMVNHLAVHAANDYDPLQAPAEEIAKFNYITNPDRKIFGAMLSKLDESVGKIVEGLKTKGILNNTIIMFYADNGAPTVGLFATSSSNFPLRGIKFSPWEGASRCNGFVYSPLIKSRQRVHEGYFHTSDILPTLASAAGIKIDWVSGYDQWDALSNGGKSPRKEIVSSLDNMMGFSAIISGQYKLVNGSTFDGVYDGHYAIEEFKMSDDFYANTILNSRTGRALTNENLTPNKILSLRTKAKISCNEASNPMVDCNPLLAPCLFNIINDPCERNNLAAVYPSTVASLKQRMNDLVRTAAPVRRTYISDPRCSPDLHQGNWEWWIADNAY